MNPNDEAPPSPTPGLIQSEGTRRYSKDEWNIQKPVIADMYPLKGMTLEKIAEFLLKERGFQANERQLKRRVKNWRLDKNVKEHEMKVIVRKQARSKAKGKVTAFRVRGLPVTQAKIDRFKKRKGYSHPDIIPRKVDGSSTPTTPTLSVISYNTISERESLSPFGQPGNLDDKRGYAQIIVTKLPMSPSQTRMMILHQPGHDSRQTHLGLPSPGINDFSDTASSFGGQSPAPFTAPSLPALSSMGSPTFGGLARTSGRPMLDQSQRPRRELASPSPPTPPPFQQQDTNVRCSIMENHRRTRYRQQDEIEHRQRLDGLVRQYGPGHPAALDTGMRLGDILQMQGRFGSAETAFRQVIEASRNAFGDRHYITLIAYARLSYTYRSQGRWQSAMTLSRKVYETSLRTLHPTHPAFLEAKIELANALRDAAKYPESERLMREVLLARASMVAPDDEGVLNCLQNLALLIEMQGKYDESEKILREVVLARSLSLGEDHPLVLVDVHNLCRSLINQGKYIECELKTRQVLATLITILGAEHPHTLKAQETLAKLLLAENRLTEGEEVARDAIEKFSRVLGPEHLITLDTERDLVQILLGKHEFKEAELLGNKVMNMSERYSGSSDLFVKSMMSLGRIHLAQGRIEEGRSMFQKATEEANVNLGEEHRTTKAFVSELAMFIQDVSRLDSGALIERWTPKWTPDMDGGQPWRTLLR